MGNIEDLKTYIFGMMVWVVLSFLLMLIINLITPLQVSYLESWGMVMFCIAFNSGWNIYYDIEDE